MSIDGLVLPLELFQSIIDICAEDDTVDTLKNLTLVSHSLRPQARQRLWEHVFLPPKQATRLAHDGRDYSEVVDGLAAVEGLSTLAKVLHLNPYPPGVLSHFIQRISFVRVEHVSIQGYSAEAPEATSPAMISDLLSRNSTGLHTLELSSARINALVLFDLLSQSQLRTLRVFRLNYIKTSSGGGDATDDSIREPSRDAVNEFLKARSGHGEGVVRPKLSVLDLNTVYSLPNPAFSDALFGHPDSLFDISSLEELSLHISQSAYQIMPLQDFVSTIDMCCHSVKTVKIYGWQDVTLSDSLLLGKFLNAAHVELVLHGSGSPSLNTGLPEASLALALPHLSKFKGLQKLTLRLRFYPDGMNILTDAVYRQLDVLCGEVPGIEEIGVVVDGFTSYNAFSWDRDQRALLPEAEQRRNDLKLDLLQMLMKARPRAKFNV